MSRRRRKRWSWSVRQYGYSVRVWEEPRSGRLYGKVSGQNKVALKELPPRARDAARRWAKQAAKDVRAEAEQPRDDQVATAKSVFALYLTHHTPQKRSANTRSEDARRVALSRLPATTSRGPVHQDG